MEQQPYHQDFEKEKYVGDLIQKKTYTPDYLTHAKKYNRGEEALVVIQNHHPPNH